MKHSSKFLLTLILIINQNLSSQEVVDHVALNKNADLIFKASNDSLFTGICERRRKNGHLVFAEYFENGVILSAKYYFNGKQKIMSDSVIYNPNKPYKYKELYRFNLQSQITEKNSYDTDGKLILVENFDNGKLIYSCQYKDKKKHGREFCYSKEDKALEFEYLNGKKVKDKD
jgi:antitoxin component YwqK of YwqJK toxin-antitoxin module